MMLLRDSQTSQSVPALRIAFVFCKGCVGVVTFHLGLPVGLQRSEKSPIVGPVIGVISYTNELMKRRRAAADCRGEEGTLLIGGTQEFEGKRGSRSAQEVGNEEYPEL
jgi:hypothetical protein